MASYKILEINVSSAQDLPPVSKLLRTFAVAWIQPDQKLSTKIDYRGHTNPAWNYKLVFRVDDKFLRNEAAVVTFEIYNVAWLRDLPIGTAYLFINHISPPLMQNGPVMRPVALHIRRPSGHLQGILHVGVNLINNNISGSPLRSELSAYTMENQDIMMLQVDDPNLEEQHSTSIDEPEVEQGNAILQRQPSVHISEMPNDDDSSNVNDGNESQTEAKMMVRTKSYNSTNLSMATAMHPLPSEVAFNLKKGFYAPDGEEYGSSVFENWSEPSDCNPASLRSKSGRWQMEDQIPLTIENDIPRSFVHEGHKPSQSKRRKHSGGRGLFSCFGKGCMFTFVYGSRKKNRQKNRRHEKLHNLSDDEIRRFYM